MAYCLILGPHMLTVPARSSAMRKCLMNLFIINKIIYRDIFQKLESCPMRGTGAIFQIKNILYQNRIEGICIKLRKFVFMSF